MPALDLSLGLGMMRSPTHVLNGHSARSSAT
jgi:hypothetical protein